MFLDRYYKMQPGSRVSAKDLETNGFRNNFHCLGKHYPNILIAAII